MKDSKPPIFREQLRILLILITLIFFSACSVPEPTWRTNIVHNLQPGELHGTVYISNTHHLGTAPLDRAEDTAINNHVAGILSQYGLVPVQQPQGANWGFIWKDEFTREGLSRIIQSGGSAYPIHLHLRTFTAQLIQTVGGTRWRGFSTEAWDEDATDKMISRRINRVMIPFPGVPGTKTGP